MINKVFKTILVLTICLGLTIPANAAVSVSDGSAFVTKAEFAADLNNLSNRMAQLENSLDAKIDSLVSSYLTRNGIWNGAKQELDTALLGKTGIYANTSSTATGYVLSYVGNTMASNSNRLVLASYADTTYTVIDTLTKSGFCVLSITFNNYINANAGRLRIDTSNDNNHVHNYNGYINCSLNIYTEAASISTQVYSYSLEKSWNASTSLVFENSFNQFAYFFVNKDDHLTAKTSTQYDKLSDYVAWDATTTSNYYWYWQPTVNYAYVY